VFVQRPNKQLLRPVEKEFMNFFFGLAHQIKQEREREKVTQQYFSLGAQVSFADLTTRGTQRQQPPRATILSRQPKANQSWFLPL
jgi:hypothetical protein